MEEKLSNPRTSSSPSLLPRISTHKHSHSQMAFANTSRCGVFRGTVPGSCPQCRDVPEADIDSHLTSWACLCGGCHAYHTPLCRRRQSVRAITRLISLQQVLFSEFRVATMRSVTVGYRDVVFPDGVSGRVIYYKHCSAPAAIEPVFVAGLPEDVKIQACCVEGCVMAIGVTAPLLAWWVEGALSLTCLMSRD